MSVSFAVQAHPLRSEMAERLAAVCLEGRAEVVWDPLPAGPASAWRTYRLALERGLDAPAGTTHRLVVQDDVYVCDHFVETVEAAAAARPDRVLALFVAGRPFPQVRNVEHARARGWSWAELDNTSYCPVVATAWPVRLLEPMLAWVDAQDFPPAFTADDELVGRYLRAAGLCALATVPSLVEHPDSVHSIASGGRRNRDGRDEGRRAYLFVEDDGRDPRVVDWSLGPG